MQHRKPTAASALAAIVGWYDAGGYSSLLPALIEAARAVSAREPAGRAQPGEKFFDALVEAKRAAFAVNRNWHLVPGMSHWIEVPGRLASFKTERGTTIRIPRTMRVPVAMFWPEERIPTGVLVAPDGPREKAAPLRLAA